MLITNPNQLPKIILDLLPKSKVKKSKFKKPAKPEIRITAWRTYLIPFCEKYYDEELEKTVIDADTEKYCAMIFWQDEGTGVAHRIYLNTGEYSRKEVKSASHFGIDYGKIEIVKSGETELVEVKSSYESLTYYYDEDKRITLGFKPLYPFEKNSYSLEEALALGGQYEKSKAEREAAQEILKAMTDFNEIPPEETIECTFTCKKSEFTATLLKFAYPENLQISCKTQGLEEQKFLVSLKKEEKQ